MEMGITKRQRLELTLRDNPDLLVGSWEFGEQQKVEIDFKTHDLPTPLARDISLCLFRVLQEALHNSAKHSGVRHFEVRLWGTSDEIHLTVRDSGAGFDREAAKKSRGLGLISMEERLRLVNGPLSIESQPKHGTTRLCPRSFQCGKRFGRQVQTIRMSSCAFFNPK